MTEPTRYEVARGVATITLDSQANRNALSQPLLRGLMAGLQAARQDDAVRVIVLTNDGTTFSAGADLKENASSLGPDALRFGDVAEAMDNSPKPIVGRIAGHAAGGAVVLVAACDVAVALDTVRIGLPEVRIGVPPVPVAAMLAHRFPPRTLLRTVPRR